MIKNKLFFYTNYEAFRLVQQTAQNHTVLTPDVRNGIFTYTVNGAPQKVNILQAAGLTTDSTIGGLMGQVPTTINNNNVGDSTAVPSAQHRGLQLQQAEQSHPRQPDDQGRLHLLAAQQLHRQLHLEPRHPRPPGHRHDFTLVPTVTNNDPVKLLSAAWRSNPKANLTNEVRFGFNWRAVHLPRRSGHPELLHRATSGSLISPGGFTNPINNFRDPGPEYRHLPLRRQRQLGPSRAHDFVRRPGAGDSHRAV